MVVDCTPRETKLELVVHNFAIISLYTIFGLCIFLNFYVLLSRNDTIYYLRIYHMIVGGLMICCCIVMYEFMWRTRFLHKLEEPHDMPRPAFYGAIVLTVGIVLGFAYFIIFDFAFQSCDKLIDAMNIGEIWLDVVYSAIMIVFCATCLLYVLHRRFFGAIHTHLDKVTRLWVNVTVCIVWIKVVIYKGYLSHQELCQRKELDGYWCPVVKRYYTCDPYTDTVGMQKIWYYINKGLLSSAIISCASEYFPVILVAHWLACGGAEEKAEKQEKKKQQGVSRLMQAAVIDISYPFVANDHRINLPVLNVASWLQTGIKFLMLVTTGCLVVRWFVFFYYTIDFDHLVADNWMVNEYITVVTNILQLLMFLSIFYFSMKLRKSRLDIHHKAEARGDLIILKGCILVLTIKCALQIVELEYQRIDHFISVENSVLQTVSLVLIEITQIIQYLAINRLLGLSDEDLKATKHFLPHVSIGGFVACWVHFGTTFLNTSVIKYQLTDENFLFSETSLITMIFTQTLFPADYLYAFTAAGCWADIIIRYLDLGTFQLGTPRVEPVEHHGHHQHSSQGKLLDSSSASSNLSNRNHHGERNHHSHDTHVHMHI